ncbi:hypothetical protein HIM_01189 [Hirsutella minnesotensis 3608]|nr:hypothetical protein HIM_01189 [Hirsutella minnesotensis 3608]
MDTAERRDDGTMSASKQWRQHTVQTVLYNTARKPHASVKLADTRVPGNIERAEGVSGRPRCGNIRHPLPYLQLRFGRAALDDAVRTPARAEAADGKRRFREDVENASGSHRHVAVAEPGRGAC